MSLHKMYCRKIKKQLNMYFNWNIGSTISLGDYGYFDKDYKFTKHGNIFRTYGIDIIPKNGNKMDIMEYGDKNEINFNSYASSGIAPLSGELNIKFLLSHSIFFYSQGYISHEFVNLGEIGRKLIKEYLNEQQNEDKVSIWEKNYVLVTKVLYSDNTILLASLNKGGEITLNADIPASVMGYKGFLSENFGISTRLERNIFYKLLTNNENTPLFSLAKIDTNFSRRPRFRNYNRTRLTPLINIASEVYQLSKRSRDRRNIVNVVANTNISEKMKEPSYKIKKTTVLCPNNLSVDSTNIILKKFKPIKPENRNNIVNIVSNATLSKKMKESSYKIKKTTALSPNDLSVYSTKVIPEEIKTFNTRTRKGITLSTKRNSVGVRIVNKNILNGAVSDLIISPNQNTRSKKILSTNTEINFKRV